MDSAANSTASAILEREETNCQLLAQKWDGQQSTELLFDSSWNLTWPLLDSSWDDGSFISDSVILKSPSDAHLPPSSDRAHQQYGQAAKSAAISTRSSKRKRKVPTVRADSWELYKERILKLHIDQGLPLPQVRIQMESDCGFIAQVRQYRTRITQWGKDKNVKSHEMKAIVRRRQHRKLLEPDKRELGFTVRGNLVDLRKIERWMKRYHVSSDMLYASSTAVPTPSTVAYRTISEHGTLMGPISTLERSPTFFPAVSAGSALSVLTSAINIPSSGSLQLHQSEDKPSFDAQVREISDSISVSLEDDMALPQVSPSLVREIDLTQFASISDKSLPLEHRLQPEPWIRFSNDTMNHLTTLQFKSIQAYRHFSQGDVDKAQYYIQSSIKRNDVPDFIFSTNAEVIKDIDRLGVICRVVGRLDDAQCIHLRTLSVRQNSFGPLHPDTILSMARLANVCTRQNNLDEAEKYAYRATEAMKITFGIKHPDTLLSMRILAVLTRDKRSTLQAQASFVPILEMFTQAFGERHPKTLAVVHEASETFQVGGDLDEVTDHMWTQAIQRLILDRDEDVSEEEDHARPSVTTAMTSTLYDHLRYLEMTRLRKQVYETQAVVFDAQMRFLKDEGARYVLTRYVDGAIGMMVKIVKARTKKLGPDHPRTLYSRRIMEEWMTAM